jgi:L-rhamnose mutarotase
MTFNKCINLTVLPCKIIKYTLHIKQPTSDLFTYVKLNQFVKDKEQLLIFCRCKLKQKVVYKDYSRTNQRLDTWISLVNNQGGFGGWENE